MEIYSLAIFLPGLSFLALGLGGRWLKAQGSNMLSCVFLGMAMLISFHAFKHVAWDGHAFLLPLGSWFEAGQVNVIWSLRFNTLTTLMICVVNTIAFLVHVYSVGYMEKDPGVPRFMAYLGLFTFMMLMLVTGENLVQIFLGWEGVGLASYLLIGFWHHKDSANQASMKAFLVNRVGDLGLILGMALVLATFHTLNIGEILRALPDHLDQTLCLGGPIGGWTLEIRTLEMVGILFFIGAMGKSAQLGLHTWLPDAMEGPTPVSALIHAATMVTAGVFLVARLSPLYELAPVARGIITVVGASTAVFAGTVALTQNDIKRVIAYSTCSQLGYMFFALGVSAYNAAVFHLFTHAFFKALLFLGAGSVIHGMSNEQDMRHMGGLAKYMPFTCGIMWIGSLALAGFPFFAGFYSKDAILEAAWMSQSPLGVYAYTVGIFVAILTAFYSWRLLFLTFHGSVRGDETVMGHVHEPDLWMSIPLLLLCMGALFTGYLGVDPFLNAGEAFWRYALALVPEAEKSLPGILHYAPLGAGVSGIVLAMVFYGLYPRGPRLVVEKFPCIYRFLLNKWYVDDLYHKIFVRPLLRIGGFLWHRGDERGIDAWGPQALSSWTLKRAKTMSRLQSGYVYHYATAMILGVAFFIAYHLVTMIRQGGV